MRRVLAAALLALAGPASAQIFSESMPAWAPGVMPYFGALDPSFLNGSVTTVLYAPLSSTSAFLPEDAGTVSHVYWDGSALQDTKGNSWTQNGTVPQVAANVGPFVPGTAGAGPYSAANNYQGPTTLMEWAGDWSVTVVWRQTSTAAAQRPIGKYNGTSGWLMDVNTGGQASCYVYDGALKTATAAGVIAVNGINVITCGRSGGTLSARLNAGAVTNTAGIGTMTSAAAWPIRIGRTEPAGSEATTSTIYEILASTTPYSDALHAARYAAVFGMAAPPITVARASDQTYGANGFVWSTPNDTLSTGTSGAEVWKAATQLYPTPSAPAAGTVTFTATGAHTFSVVGTGSQQISLGTATGTGFPCTATEASPCTGLSVTVTGTATLAAVTGSLTYGQVETGTYRTPQILAFPSTRAATVASTPLPPLGSKWAISVTVTPGSGRSWSTDTILFATDSFGTPNTFHCEPFTDGKIYCNVYGGGSGAKGLNWTHGYANGSTHRVTLINNQGTIDLCSDGVLVAATKTGVGTGVLTANPAILRIGSTQTVLQFDGALSNLKGCKGATKCSDCR